MNNEEWDFTQHQDHSISGSNTIYFRNVFYLGAIDGMTPLTSSMPDISDA